MTEATAVQVANPQKGGEILRDRRLEMEVTTSDLAAVCNKTPTHISEIEHGRRTPSPELLEAICDQLRLDGPQRIEIFVLFGQMPTEVERFTERNRTRVIRSIQRMIQGDTKDGKWPLSSRNGSGARKKGKKKAAKKAAAKKAASKPRSKAASGGTKSAARKKSKNSASKKPASKKKSSSKKAAASANR